MNGTRDRNAGPLIRDRSAPSKCSFHGARVGENLHKRVFDPTIIERLGAAQCLNPVAHHGDVGEQAEKANLCIAGEDEPRVVWTAIKPGFGSGVMGMSTIGERKPDVEIRKKQCHAGSRPRGTAVLVCL